jgi:hypothetical protein
MLSCPHMARLLKVWKWNCCTLLKGQIHWCICDLISRGRISWPGVTSPKMTLSRFSIAFDFMMMTNEKVESSSLCETVYRCTPSPHFKNWVIITSTWDTVDESSLKLVWTNHISWDHPAFVLYQFGRPDVDGRIIFKIILKKYDVSWDWIQLAKDRGPVAGFFEDDNEPWFPYKARSFLTNWAVISNEAVFSTPALIHVNAFGVQLIFEIYKSGRNVHIEHCAEGMCVCVCGGGCCSAIIQF